MIQSRSSTRQTNGCFSGLGYVLCIGAAITGGSTIVVVGMGAVASGVPALAVASIVPLAGLAWVVGFSMRSANQVTSLRPEPHQGDQPRLPRGHPELLQPLSGSDRW